MPLNVGNIRMGSRREIKGLEVKTLNYQVWVVVKALETNELL